MKLGDFKFECMIKESTLNRKNGTTVNLQCQARPGQPDSPRRWVAAKLNRSKHHHTAYIYRNESGTGE